MLTRGILSGWVRWYCRVKWLLNFGSPWSKVKAAGTSTIWKRRKILKRSDAFLIDNRRHRFFFVRLCVFTCAKLHIQIFVDQQTNISIEDIFVQTFRYRKGGERAGYGSTVDVLCYPAKPISLPDPCPYAFFFCRRILLWCIWRIFYNVESWFVFGFMYMF